MRGLPRRRSTNSWRRRAMPMSSGCPPMRSCNERSRTCSSARWAVRPRRSGVTTRASATRPRPGATRAEARGGGLGREGLGGGELGGGLGEARGDHGDDEVAAAVAVRSEDAVEPDLAQRAEDGGDVTVRQRAANGEHLRGGWDRNDGSALEQGLEAFQETGGPVGEVAKRAFLDLSALAIGLAQEDGGRRAAVGDHLDEHAHPECHEPPRLTRTRTRFTCLQSGRRTAGSRAIPITCAYRKQEVRFSPAARPRSLAPARGRNYRAQPIDGKAP